VAHDGDGQTDVLVDKAGAHEMAGTMYALHTPNLNKTVTVGHTSPPDQDQDQVKDQDKVQVEVQDAGSGDLAVAGVEEALRAELKAAEARLNEAVSLKHKREGQFRAQLMGAITRMQSHLSARENTISQQYANQESRLRKQIETEIMARMEAI